ncbi:cell division protein FtsQ [Loktanella sp. 3ANDIMAR09]|uniref:cell division protein FtsQ/DivIB n=1 Tax=Loktanella sp. 3ANDIMAR09 TaxID=1225657 RepID=UPI0006FCBE65|nr:cell division protein FtsQ/DivIB [Loktanella sp. 3ANDIMAR09]KQI69472.1 cell division protein FtsQ [Loktanella sp. 3ANDIMAR09]
MRPVTRPIRDPAPSKWGYRWQRWMLTPGVRTGLRLGVPALIIAAIAGGWSMNAGNRALLAERITAAQQAFQERPQFMVSGLAINGTDEELADAVASLVETEFPVSSFDLDLNKLRDDVVALDAVAEARVRVGDAGALEINVTPRVPVAIWRTPDGLRMIDAEGVFAGDLAARVDRLDLPLIGGDGVQGHIDEALTLFRSAGPIADRMRGLVRVSGRRWNMVLEDGQQLLLPADAPVAALDRIIALHEAQDLLDRDVAIVDMRMPQRPTVRMNPEAVAATRNAATTGRIQQVGQ